MSDASSFCRTRGGVLPSRAPSPSRTRRNRSRRSSTPTWRSGSTSRARPASGSETDSREIAFEDLTVDRGQRHEIGGRDVLVDLVHLLAQQAELDHRAVIL